MLHSRPAVPYSFQRTNILLPLFVCVLLFSVSAAVAQNSVWAWGDNEAGQLGNGTFTTTPPFGIPVPVQTSGLTGMIVIAGGGWHSLATKSDGSVWAWGSNRSGELGDGTNIPRNVPVQVRGLTEVVAIASGFLHSLAVKSDGTAWTWGDNTYGQLGNGSNIASNVPVQVSDLTGVLAVAGSSYVGYNQYSLALKSDGTVWAWGDNEIGQLGDGTTGNIRTVPVQVRGLTSVVAIACGGFHSLALKSDGTVWAWGNNSDGELGNGTTILRSIVPVQTSGLTGVVAIAAGVGHSLALKSDGTVWAWGGNNNRQLGTDTISMSTVPVQVGGLSGILAIASGFEHSLALKSDGTVWAWGLNYYGQLGNGTFTTTFPMGIATPAPVRDLTGAVAIAGGYQHSLAIVAPTAVVSGTIGLQNCVNSVQPLLFTFRPSDGSAPFTLTVTLSSTGDFRLPSIPRKSYSVWIKGAKWLAKVVSVDASAGDVSGVTATLRAGDVNNDNAITTADYLLLKAAFGSVAGDPNWNAAADLNCDGVISTADYLLLAANLGAVGDP